MRYFLAGPVPFLAALLARLTPEQITEIGVDPPNDPTEDDGDDDD